MKIHILGICGTFMGGIAQIARQAGHEVSGSDANVYPPMSTQLQAAGIGLQEGFEPAHLRPAPDCVVVGNVMSRGNLAVEYLLDEGLAYTSGPQWLGEEVLRGRWVLAVAGTHGKTTTASMLAWILEYAGLNPGFLVGGVPRNFDCSARLTDSRFFVVEADEYDTAFFDKRSKFVHYHPRTLILNNLEFDHADIFGSLAEIQRQFHHLVRIVPGQGAIISNASDQNLADTLAMGCWTPVQGFGLQDAGAEWGVHPEAADGSRFRIVHKGEVLGEVVWEQVGRHNMLNAVAAVAAAAHAGVPPRTAMRALERFAGVKRRLEVLGEYDGITLYDDFAHHPTAIDTTLRGMRAKIGPRRLVAVLEPRSNTMRMGVHRQTLAASLEAADEVYMFRPDDLQWDPGAVSGGARVLDSLDDLVDALAVELRPGDQVVIMSNGGFGGLHGRLAERLAARASGGAG